MITNTDVTCPAQHLLAPAENLYLLHRRDSGPNYKTNRYECNACGKTYHTASSATQHCASCRFDLCPKCYSVQQSFSLTCFQGHPLFKVTNLWSFHERCSYMNNLYTCDFCQNSFDASETPAAHCSFCKFSLCTGCVKEQQQLMKPEVRSSSQRINTVQSRGNTNSRVPGQQNMRIIGENLHSSGINSLRRYGNRSEIPISNNSNRPTILDERPLPGGGQRRWDDLFQQALDAGFAGGLVHEQMEEQEESIEDMGVIDLRPILLPEQNQQNQRNQNLTRNRVESRLSVSQPQPQPEPVILNPVRSRPERRPVIERQPVIERRPVIERQPVIERRPVIERQPAPQAKPKPKPKPKPAEVEESKENVEPNRESDSSNALLCVVCLEAPRSHIYEPCKHLCTCEKCSQFLTKGKKPCPICRKPIKGITKIFIA